MVVGRTFWLGGWLASSGVSQHPLSVQSLPSPSSPALPRKHTTHNRSLAGLKVAQAPLPGSPAWRGGDLFREQEQDQAGRKAALGDWPKLPVHTHILDLFARP